MNDTDIIKALECCFEKDLCNECPLAENIDCLRLKERGAIVLINRQKEEIEKQEAEIERLKKILDYYALEYGTVLDKSKVISKVKAEAAKELVERVKHIIGFDDLIPTDCVMLFPYLDNLVKEFPEGKADDR